MRTTRSKIAAGATIASLAVLGGVAYAAGSGDPETASTQATSTPEVRTEVVRRTIHRRVVEGERSGSGAAAPVAPSSARTLVSATASTHGRHSTHVEAGDDHGGGGELEAGDDHGGDRGELEAGDDHGGDDGSSGHGGGGGDDDSSGHGGGDDHGGSSGHGGGDD